MIDGGSSSSSVAKAFAISPMKDRVLARMLVELREIWGKIDGDADIYGLYAIEISKGDRNAVLEVNG